MESVLEKGRPVGTYHVFALDENHTEEHLDLIRRHVRGEKVSLRGVPIQRRYIKKNVIPNAGKDAMLRRLAGDTTYTGIINYGALGTSSAAKVYSDTTLGVEVFRKTSTGGYTSAVGSVVSAYIDFYYAAGDVADGTYQEFGAFIDGTASANTGQAASLIATGGWVKSGALFIILQWSLT